MSKQKEFLIILLISIGIPIFSYVIAYSFFSKTDAIISFNPSNIQLPTHKKETEPLSLLFVGDIMLDRTIRKDGEIYGYPNLFACLEEEFSKHDAVIGNLEGTITSFSSVSKDAPYESPQSFRFTFDTRAVETLVDSGLSIVSLANNHIRDFGNEGIEQTIQNAFEINLATFGDPRTKTQRYIIQDIKGTKIAFIPYNQFFGTSEQTYEDLKNAIQHSDIQIIFAHWGDEYIPAQTNSKMLAHNFVDIGADLIIGAHPHIIQEHEKYKDVSIYYSLGNFIFDQYWEEKVQNGLAVITEIQDKKISNTRTLQTKSIRHKGTCFQKKSTTI